MPVGSTYLSDLDLDGSVVLSGDESVSGGALSWDIDVHNVTFVVLHLCYELEKKSIIIIK